MDMGIYALQATRYLTGEEPMEVTAVTTVTDPIKFSEVEESIVWQARFPSGVLANCSASYGVSGLVAYRALASKGWFGLDPAYAYQGIHGSRSDNQTISLPPVNQFAAEMDDFAQCILSNRPTRVPGEEGLRDVKIMRAIYEAARSGTTVKLG